MVARPITITMTPATRPSTRRLRRIRPPSSEAAAPMSVNAIANPCTNSTAASMVLLRSASDPCPLVDASLATPLT
jgi:hypothetical protein